MMMWSRLIRAAFFFYFTRNFCSKIALVWKKYPIFVVAMENFTPFVSKLWKILPQLQRSYGINTLFLMIFKDTFNRQTSEKHL